MSAVQAHDLLAAAVGAVAVSGWSQLSHAVGVAVGHSGAGLQAAAVQTHDVLAAAVGVFVEYGQSQLSQALTLLASGGVQLRL